MFSNENPALTEYLNLQAHEGYQKAVAVILVRFLPKPW